MLCNDDEPVAERCQQSRHNPVVFWQRDLEQRWLTPKSSAAADVMHLTSLTRLTHLDLGFAQGVVALAQQLSNLQSLALHMPYSHTLVSAVQRQYSQTNTHHACAWCLLLCW
jgi:hypothetical protein